MTTRADYCRFARYRNKLELVKGLDSRHLLSLATVMAMSVSVSNVPKRSLPPSVEP